jgi:aspartyl-tRNA(Asn)/glutamyl-tRNA(Gln) amidotransferase subunit B
MEQDTAKSYHDRPDLVFLDFNRAGMPLLEIVTYPEIYHPTDGKLAIKELQDTLKALNISDANMEEGQMRCDVNISLHRGDVSGNRVEIKNVMGIRFVEKAIEFEIKRQAALLKDGLMPEFETRRYDAVNDKTISLRSKNDNLDYRFIREPDLPYFKINPLRVAAIKEILDKKKLPFDQKMDMIN